MITLRRAVGKNRGVAVLLALFFMILLALIGVALIGLVPVELRSSTRTKLDLQAHYTVTTGIRHARAWCAAVMTPTGSTTDTPATRTPDDLGDNPTTWDATGTSIYNAGASRINDITGVDGAAAVVEYTPMRLKNLYASGLIPTNTSNWADVYKMLNIASTGPSFVDGETVVLVKKTPLVLGDWSAYSVIIPDADTPGGINTQDASHHITTFFGGSGKAGRRCYQIVSLAFYQGFPTLRGKSTVLEDSFARYSLFVNHDATNGGWVMQALPGQTTTLGPVHTNETFKFAIDPAVWGQGASAPIPFNGLLTFGQYADASNSTVVSSLNHDGAIYSQGNDNNGQGTQYRPFDNAGNDPSGRYNKMVAGGRSNLRATTSVKLPPDSSKLANAAFGNNYNTGLYSGASVSGHVAPLVDPDGAGPLPASREPNGIFVFPNTSGKAAGGIVLKGDQQNMFLEVVGTNARPITNITAIENGTATGNPGIRVQASRAQTGTVTTTVTIPAGSTVTSTSIGQTVTSFTTTSVGSSSTGRITITNSGPRTLFSTVTNLTPTSSTNLTYLKSTQTNWTTFPLTTRVTQSTGISLTTVGQAGGIVQTITQYTTFNSTTGSSSTSNKTTFTTSTQTGTTPYTITNSSSFSTGVTTTTNFTTQTLYGTGTVTNTVTGTSTIYAPITITNPPSTSTGVTTVIFKAMDQLIEAKNVGVSLSPSMFQTSTNDYKDPIGAHTGGSNPQSMDVSKVAGITQLLLVGSGGSVTPMGATTVGTGTVVVIKQSRTDPSKALVFLVPADANSDGDLLNGAVYSQGNIGNPNGGVNQRGLAGVNMGRKTIGTQIKPVDTTVTNSTDPFDKQFADDSKMLGIVNNLAQYGTKRRENDPDQLKSNNGLGLVGEDIRVTADPDQFSSFWNPATTPNYNDTGTNNNFLNIHAVMLAGSQTQGGLTIHGFQDINSITPGSIGAGATGRTPLIRFVGGLIVQNYFGRINALSQAGWMSKNLYNQQLALNPPPYFPNNGLLIPLSYIEERIWADQKL